MSLDSTQLVNSLSPTVGLGLAISHFAISAALSMVHKVTTVTISKDFSFRFSLLMIPQQHLWQSLLILTYLLKRRESETMASRFEGQIPFVVPLYHSDERNL